MFADNDEGTGIALAVALGVAAALVFGVVIYAINNAARKPSANAESSAASIRPLALGTLAFAVANGKLTLTGTAPDDARKTRLANQAALLFGSDNVINNITIDPADTGRGWKGKSLDLMTKLYGLGDFSLNLDGKSDTINFKGAAASDAAKAELMTWLNTFFKDGAKVHVDIDINPALANTGTHSANVMFNENIEFASGGAELPEAAKARLNLIANVLRDDARKLNIVGHTDSQGNADANRALSIKRAESVKAFLVANGVADANLVASGVGQEQPVADNATTEGRQKNRRIAFLQ